MTEKTLTKWIEQDPVTNESTHFGCIMDPKTGSIIWLKRGPDVESDESEEDRVREISVIGV